MFQLMQLRKLSLHAVCPIFIVLLITGIFLPGCSKTETLTPGKPRETVSYLQFKLDTSGEFDEQTLKEISLKLKLSVTGIDARTHTSTILWDTLITRNSLYEYLHSRDAAAVQTTIGTTPGQPTRLVLNYLIIYNKHGELITKTGSSTFTGKEQDHILVRI